MVAKNFLLDAVASMQRSLRSLEHTIKNGEHLTGEEATAYFEKIDDKLRGLRSDLIHNIGLIGAASGRHHPLDRNFEDKDNPCHCCHCEDRRRRQKAQWHQTLQRYPEIQGE